MINQLNRIVGKQRGKNKIWNNKMKFILPIFFVFIYMGIYSFISLYKKQLARIKGQ